MITIRNDDNDEMKNIIHTNLRKSNMKNCEWLKNNVSDDIKKSDIKYGNFLVFDDNKLN